ncbi:NAD(P)/FAD-dependent oxidoreductase [Streptomyces antarcticus]|uniref:NAD(P)/FAD-dependent oxidoreductase n=1 Tax=Streptomyces antarcticus TaxID=2996458 RepID=UPI00226E09C4|nr:MULTISPECIES: NAD(P)/FAD-dependent oxidoreductase [unclassified Streptomyces]MCY0944302.1 NAD(P)/FAD-dependent oxidoreductase [Streptomyces sp. H34-AA3]MCZ4087378.1 NAD(P)/FAD-dependent oxidoreductase [Streptomyces sp. H34-S5]
MDTRRASRNVLVVGAGLAGLACARDLAAAGLSVQVLEAGDGVGGRVRSDRVRGFVIDRGFQVFNTSYPQVKARMDLRALRLSAFTPGVVTHRGAGRLRRLVDPSRRPREVRQLLTGGVSPRDLAALGALSARDLCAPAALLRRGGRERTTLEVLRGAGFSDAFVEEFFRPFLSGVFLEDELETSGRVFHLVWRSMLRGTLCLPAGGIGAVPGQLADGLPPGAVRLETAVTALTDDGVLTAEHGELAAAAVVVATGPGAARRLLDGVEPAPYRTVTTYYHEAPGLCGYGPDLVTDTARRFLNTCVQSEVSPGYAPAGTSLVATSVLGPGSPGTGTALLGVLAEVYGRDTAHWEEVAVRTVEEALPAMTGAWPLSRPSRAGRRRYVCGDHRATGSVQGALASGARAAREVLADLAGPAR